MRGPSGAAASPGEAPTLGERRHQRREAQRRRARGSAQRGPSAQGEGGEPQSLPGREREGRRFASRIASFLTLIQIVEGL